jgi:hypothetical protein
VIFGELTKKFPTSYRKRRSIIQIEREREVKVGGECETLDLTVEAVKI